MNDSNLALADCLDALEWPDVTLEECAARYPDQQAVLLELLPLAQALRAALDIAPSPDFRLDARQRLIARLPPARQRPTRLDAGRPWRARHLVLVHALAIILFVALLGSSVLIAAAQSLPNDALYPIKLVVEHARLAMAVDQISSGELHVAFAAERLNEAQRLIAAGRGEDADVALDGFADQVQSAIEIARTISNSAEHDRLLSHLEAAIDQSNLILMQTGSQLPASVQPALQRARDVLQTPQRKVMPLPASTSTTDPHLSASTLTATPVASRPPVSEVSPRVAPAAHNAPDLPRGTLPAASSHPQAARPTTHPTRLPASLPPHPTAQRPGHRQH